MLPVYEPARKPGNATLLWALGIGATAAYVGYSVAKASTQNQVDYRPGDDAPVRTRRDHPVAGRTITINRPRGELFAFWADFSNLSKFMQSIRNVSLSGDVASWEVAAPLGRSLTLKTRMTDRRDNEYLAWSSTDGSDVDVSGSVTFKDAPAGRGTELEAQIFYAPAMGELGRWVGKLFQTDPVIQGRRELRRFKMLMEAGEIATNQNRKVTD